MALKPGRTRRGNPRPGRLLPPLSHFITRTKDWQRTYCTRTLGRPSQSDGFGRPSYYTIRSAWGQASKDIKDCITSDGGSNVGPSFLGHEAHCSSSRIKFLPVKERTNCAVYKLCARVLSLLFRRPSIFLKLKYVLRRERRHGRPAGRLILQNGPDRSFPCSEEAEEEAIWNWLSPSLSLSSSLSLSLPLSLTATIEGGGWI